jgi:beta-lactamase family protein
MSYGNRIRFLGTGAGDCVEMRHESGRTEPDANKSGEKDARHAAGLFIPPGIVVDRFSPERLRACGVEEKDVHHLLISHGHQDHFQPMALLDLAARLPHQLTLHGNATVGNALDFAATHHWNGDTGAFEVRAGVAGIPVTELKPGDTFSIGDIKGTAVLANHMIDKKNMIQQEQALNFVLERAGMVLFYGLDSSYVLPETMEILAAYRFDIVIMDATFGHMVIDPVVSGHHNFDMLEKTIAQFRQAGMLKDDAIIVADHISYDAVEPYDEIVEELAEKGITLAYDGMTLEW